MTGGQEQSVRESTAILRADPNGAADRTLIFGDRFCALDTCDGWTFGFAGHDGYVGYLPETALGDAPEPTHRVTARLTQALPGPDLKRPDGALPLSMGSSVTVSGKDGDWAEIVVAPDRVAFVPQIHLAPMERPETDPVTVAERLLGAPYHWAGNASTGIDCSGLVQIACRLCDIPCPGDSDQQQESLGRPCPEGTSPQRGDLLFWEGHVAWVSDPETILHANAGTMSVSFEPMAAAIARIARQGDGPVIAHRRIARP